MAGEGRNLLKAEHPARVDGHGADHEGEQAVGEGGEGGDEEVAAEGGARKDKQGTGDSGEQKRSVGSDENLVFHAGLCDSRF